MMALVEWVNPASDDQLIFLGDYVNRGPDSDKVLAWLTERSENLAPGHPSMICLRGNHEIMMMEERADRMEKAERRFVDGLASYHESPTHVFVHACVDGSIPMKEQPDYFLHWERFGSMTAPLSGKKVVCGHTVQKSGRPLQNDFAVCIDTNCCRGGWLTCLDVGTGQYFQTNQDLDRREGSLKRWAREWAEQPQTASHHC